MIPEFLSDLLKCITPRSLIGNIVKFNNSQNKVTAADFRSNDEIQKRLVSEVDAIDKSIVYQGGRRGGDDAAIKRKKNVMPSFTVAQALASFHGDPVSAYNKKSFLWNDDAAYSKIFNEKNYWRAYHICLFAFQATGVDKVRSPEYGWAGGCKGSRSKKD